MINWNDYDVAGIVNGEEVESIAEWFEENEDFCGGVDITIPEQMEERYRICVKKEMVQHPVLTNQEVMPTTQMVGKKIANFAGYYIMDLCCEDDPRIRWRGKVPKHFILEMEEI